jgi:hypothetical protein
LIRRVLVVSSLPAMVQRELAIAQAMVKLIRIQDHCIDSLRQSLDKEDAADLETLIGMAERLELDTHPMVARARERVRALDRKKSVMLKLVQFLKPSNDEYEPLTETLEQARELGVDMDFLSEVQMMYDNTAPRLLARQRLRRAVEAIDIDELTDGIAEIGLLQQHFPGFGETELRAGKGVLRMIELERSLTG